MQLSQINMMILSPVTAPPQKKSFETWPYYITSYIRASIQNEAVPFWLYPPISSELNNSFQITKIRNGATVKKQLSNGPVIKE